MRLRGWFKVGAVAALVVIAACAEPAKPPPPAAPVAAPAPPPRPRPVAEAPPPKDACSAAPLQYLVGKPRTDIPVPVNPSSRRVVCSACSVTMDFVPSRQTITYDESTGLVTSVKCG